MTVRLIALFFIMINILCLAQTDSLQLVAEETLEYLLEETENESDNSDLYDLMQYYITHPVNLNSASAEELSFVPYLDLSIARIIIDHRENFGKFFSVYELYSLSEIKQSVIKKILPFVSIEDSPFLHDPGKIKSNRFSLDIRTRILYDIQQREGYREKIFIGSPYKYYNRVTVKYSDNISAGFLTEKDAGEIMFSDFYSGYISLSRCYNFENIVIGDFLIEFGRGLALWSPYGLSKSSNAVYSVGINSRKIVPYKSTSESGFFRGSAVQYNWEHVELLGFFSKVSRDANIDSVSGKITSIPINGLHRTQNEINKKNAVAETSYGIIINYSLPRHGSFGILHYSSRLNRSLNYSSIMKRYPSIFNYYSIYVNLYLLNYNIFGELSFSGKSSAAICGINLSPSPGFSYITLIRNYSGTYMNMHGYSFGEHDNSIQNEIGIYNGFRWRTTAGVFNLYYDIFKFPFAYASSPLPTEGNELMINYSLKLSKQIETITRIKIENKEINVPFELQNKIVKRLKNSYRLEFTYTISEVIRLKTRLEYSTFFIKDTPSFEEGYMFFEDFRIKPINDLVFYSRIIFFKTNSFNSAVYEFENDLPGIFRSTALYGEGLRFYLVLKYKIIDILNLSIKYSETYKPGEAKLGTGYQIIEGNIDNGFGLQLDLNI